MYVSMNGSILNEYIYKATFKLKMKKKSLASIPSLKNIYAAMLNMPISNKFQITFDAFTHFLLVQLFIFEVFCSVRWIVYFIFMIHGKKQHHQHKHNFSFVLYTFISFLGVQIYSFCFKCIKVHGSVVLTALTLYLHNCILI